MAKYLWTASYTTEGIQGLLRDGGSKRREATESLAASVGGKVESFYYALGEDDLYVVVELPDDVAAVAASLIVSAAGTATVRTTRLLSAEEIDAATKQSVEYSPPGS